MSTASPVVCNLVASEASDRAEWMAGLGRDLLALEAEGPRALLRFEAAKLGQLEEFVRAESACCSFFEFELSVENGAAELSVAAPADARWAVRGLVAGFVAGWGKLV